MSVSTTTFDPKAWADSPIDFSQFCGTDRREMCFEEQNPFSLEKTTAQIRTRMIFEHLEEIPDSQKQAQSPLQAILSRTLHIGPCVTGLVGGTFGSLVTQHLLPLLLGLTQCFLGASAQQKVGGEFRINNYTIDDQWYPDLASFPNGNFVVTWGSKDQEGSKSEVYAQLFSGNATKIGNEFRVNNYTIETQDDPTVTSFPNGNFVVTWYSWAQDGDALGVFGQLFDENAIKIGNEFQVNTYTNHSQWYPAATSFPNGNFAVTWQSDYLRMLNEEIFGQLFDENATKIGNEFQVNTYINNSQSYPAMTSFPNGNFIVTWQSNRQDGSLSGVYGQLFDGNTTKIRGEFQINNYTNHNQGYPAVASFSNGNFVVTWESWGQDGSEDGIFGQLFDENGMKIGNEFQVNTFTLDYQSRPAVTILYNGHFVVIWEGYRGFWRIYGQLFDENVWKLGNEFQINTFNTTFQGQLSAAPLTNGNFVVTWYSKPQDGSGAGVYGQLFHDNTTLSSSSTTTSSPSLITSSSTFSTTSTLTFRTISSIFSKTITSTTTNRYSFSTTLITSSSISSTTKDLSQKTYLETNHARSSPLSNARLLWLWLLLGLGGGTICVGAVGYLFRKFRSEKRNNAMFAAELKKIDQMDGSQTEEHYQRTPDCVTQVEEYQFTPDCVSQVEEYQFTPDCVTAGQEVQ